MMIHYLSFLLGGAALGCFRGRGSFRRFQRHALPASVLVLLFFMGVGIGKDPDLGSKILGFGWKALAISSFSVFFSVLCVGLLTRALRRSSR